MILQLRAPPVDFDAIEMPVELRAAEVVIKGPSFEMTVINSQLSTMNNSQSSIILDLEKEVYFAGIITLYSISNRGIESGIGIDKPSKNPKSGLAKGLCPRVLSLFEFSFTT